MSELPTTVWLTKYALTIGVKQCDVLRMYGNGFAHVRWDGGFARRVFPSDYRDTREAALARAEEMRAAKITSLSRQLERLKALEF
jgi:hypothetical protein